MEETDLTLWGMGTVRNLRVHWMLMEMGLDYTFFPVHPRSGETYTEEFLRINPRHKVPVLRHRDVVVTESAAIIEYVSEAFEPPPGIYVAQTAQERAKLNEWCFFIMTEFDAHTLYVIRRHTTFSSLYGESPTACKAAKEYFMDQLNAIAPRIGDDGFLLGGKFSCADILLTTCIDWAIEYAFELPASVMAYYEKHSSRPAYKNAFNKTFMDPASIPDLMRLPDAAHGLCSTKPAV
ncbi:glutathione S-transferase family protein [Paraburkholderia xenovorans]|uniref:glutathione S-transferase family protein n=1 Tax=Paraburkholderia xenovorans TaxID=36873 RepID=UPI0038B822D2